MPKGTFSFGAAEPPFAGGLPHGRVGPMIEGEAGAWIIVPVDAPQDGRIYARQNRVWIPITILAEPVELSRTHGRRAAIPGVPNGQFV